MTSRATQQGWDVETGHLATWVFVVSLYAGLIVISHSLVVHALPTARRAVDRVAATTRQALAPQAGRRTQGIGLSENVENVAAADTAPAYRGNGQARRWRGSLRQWRGW